MALGSTRPLTKTSTRMFLGGKGGRRVGLTTLPPSVTRMSENVGASTSHIPKDLHGLYRDSFYLTLPFYPSYTHVRALSQFLLHIFLLSPAELAWSPVIKTDVVNLTFVRESVPCQQTHNCLTVIKNIVLGPRWALYSRTHWTTHRQS
jgi:hypothetical protein